MTARQRQNRRRRAYLRQRARDRQVERELTALLRRMKRDLEQRRIHAEYVKEMRGRE